MQTKMARKPGVDVNALISAVKDNPALWDCRHEEYKLAENKPLLWLKIADQLKCEKSKYSISNCHRPIGLVRPQYIVRIATTIGLYSFANVPFLFVFL
jgi:hypothetical protein